MIGVVELFVCLECNKNFSEPVHWEETHGLDTPPYEHFSGCPYCKGNYTEAFICDCCGDYIVSNYIKTDDDRRYCENCICTMQLGEED